MKRKRCIVLVPTSYNDGQEVPAKEIAGILKEVDGVFDGHYVAGHGAGTYRMEDGSMAEDRLLEVWIALEPDKVEILRKMVARFARRLKQEAVYFEVRDSEVEVIAPDENGGGE